jgi:hypothetical protein
MFYVKAKFMRHREDTLICIIKANRCTSNPYWEVMFVYRENLMELVNKL